MTTDVLDDIVRDGMTALDGYPDAYQQLLRVLADPTSNTEHVAAVVRVDPVLTARLLAFVNAAHVGRRITNVAHAAMLVGRRQLRNLATASAVVHMFRGIPEHLVDMGAYWRHSLAVAIAANHLGLASPRRITGLFVPALLHDIGALLLFVARPNDARRILIETENRDVEGRIVERSILGTDHAELGARLQASWQLPERTSAVARYHHEPSAAPEEMRRSVDVVHLADVAVSALQIGNAGERSAHRLDEEAWTRSGLRPEGVRRSLDGLVDEVDEIARALGP